MKLHPALLLATAVSLTTSAHAQNPSSAGTDGTKAAEKKDGDGQTLKPVIVTADREAAGPYAPPAETSVTGLTAPLRELPLTVNTVTDQFIQDTSARRVRDLVGYIPGVNAAEDSGATGDLLNIRGFDFLYQTYVNGMRNRASYNASRGFGNIDRVEFFKGPGGVEFGAGDPGGFINYVTKKPQAVSSTLLGVEGGSFDYYGGYFDSTGPLWTPSAPASVSSGKDGKGTAPAAAPPGGEGLFYRFIVSGQDGNSFRDNFRYDDVLVAPSLLWNYAEGSSVLLEFEYHHRNQPYDRGILYIEGAGFPRNFAPIERSYHEPDDFLDSNVTRTSLYWTHKINNNVSFRFTGEYNTSSAFGRAVRNPSTFVLYEEGTNAWNGVNTIPRTTQRFDGDNYSYGFKPEMLFKFDTGGVEHNSVLGFNYLMTSIDTRSQDGFDSRPIDFLHPVYGLPPIILPPANPNDPNSIPVRARDFHFAQELEEYGLYYQHKADLSDRLHLLGGIRYDWYSDENAVSRNIRANPLPPLSGYSDQNFSWRTGAVYDLTGDFSVFAGYSNSFQPQQGLLIDGSSPDALEATAWEAGIKGSFLNNRLQTTLSVYETERKNMLEADPNDPTFTYVAMLGTVRVRGVEFEATGKVTDDLSIQGGFAFMDSEITETTDDATRGNDFYNIPDFQAGVRLRYDTSKWLTPGLSLGLGVIYVGEREGDALNSFELPSYVRWDAGLYYHVNNWDFKVTCENVADKDYYLASQGFADIIQPGAPRTFVFGAQYHF